MVYGTAWDEIIRFLKANDKYKNIDKDSRGFGNLGINYNSDGIDTTNVVIPTGSNEKYCLNNIYDFAGNAWEWTMETYKGQSSNAILGRLLRGGGYSHGGNYCPVSIRGSSTSITILSFYSGRVQLYIK